MIQDRTQNQFNNPFKRITFSEEERAESKKVWNCFYVFWQELAPLIPDGPDKTLVMRHLQQALFCYEAAHTESVKIKRGE